MNQALETYLHIFCNYEQNNWFEILSFAEFAYNNAVQESTKMSPIFANYGFHPCFLAESQSSSGSPLHAAPAAEEFRSYLPEVHERLV